MVSAGEDGQMTKKAFDKIAAGLTEAIEIARGNAKPARLYVPAEIDVKTTRGKAGVSQTFSSGVGRRPTSR